MEFPFRVLSHLVLPVLAFIWGCSRAEPKMAAAAACAGRVHTGLGCRVTQEKPGEACSRSGLLKLVAKRVGLFSWRRWHIADAAVERECPCALGFVALAGNHPFSAGVRNLSMCCRFAEQDWPFLKSSTAYLSVSVDDREVYRMMVISGLVNKFTKRVA